jgi:hypothetical protein
MESKITREVVNKPLIDLINCDVFDCEAERGVLSDKDIQIPDRQRYPRWDKKDWPLLVDSIMANYPMPNFLMTQEIVNGKLVHFLQDGQTRASIAQDYIKGKYLWKNKKYSEFDAGERCRFDNYLVSVTLVKKKPGTTDKEFKIICRDIFERVNKGKPLSDNDKFHNCKDEPLLKAIMALKAHPEFRVTLKEIFGDVGGDKSKTRVYLANMVGLWLSLIQQDSNLFRGCYDKNIHYIIAEDDSVVVITDEKIDSVKVFFRFYFALAQTIRETSEYKISKSFFNKPSGMMALVLEDWLAGLAQNRRAMWVDYAVKVIADKTYERRIFKSLSKSKIQNNTAANFRARIDCVEAAYKKPELAADGSEAESDAAAESDYESGGGDDDD